eukprot:3103060-Rhodomonas_salina.1
MGFAGVDKSEEELVLQFIHCLKNLEDRHTILQKDCQTMEEVYVAVQTIRQAKTLAGRVVSTSGGLHSSVEPL